MSNAAAGRSKASSSATRALLWGRLSSKEKSSLPAIACSLALLKVPRIGMFQLIIKSQQKITVSSQRKDLLSSRSIAQRLYNLQKSVFGRYSKFCFLPR